MFITNFDIKDFPLYRKAVASWNHPEKSCLRVSKNPKGKINGDGGSLHWFGKKKNLEDFWEHFDKLKNIEQGKQEMARTLRNIQRERQETLKLEHKQKLA